MAARPERRDRLVHGRIAIDAIARFDGQLHPIQADIQSALRRRDRDDQLPLVAAVEDVRDRVVDADHGEQLAVEANCLAHRLFAIEQPLDDLAVDEHYWRPRLVLALGEVAPGRNVAARHLEPVGRIADELNARKLAIGVLDTRRTLDVGAYALDHRQRRDLPTLIEGEGTETDPRAGLAATVARLEFRWPP